MLGGGGGKAANSSSPDHSGSVRHIASLVEQTLIQFKYSFLKIEIQKASLQVGEEL